MVLVTAILQIGIEPFAQPKLTISDDKVLLVEITEKNGARHQTTEITSREILNAKLL